MEDKANKVREYLTAKGVEFEMFSHPAAASASDYSAVVGTQLEQQVKVIVCRFKGESGKGYIAVGVPACKQVDLEKVRDLLGARKVGMAGKDELFRITGCSFGEVHAFPGAYGLKLIMDRELLQQEFVYMNAGHLEVSVRVRPQAIIQAEDPKLF